jgi:hypothetical protein
MSEFMKPDYSRRVKMRTLVKDYGPKRKRKKARTGDERKESAKPREHGKKKGRSLRWLRGFTSVKKLRALVVGVCAVRVASACGELACGQLAVLGDVKGVPLCRRHAEQCLDHAEYAARKALK